MSRMSDQWYRDQVIQTDGELEIDDGAPVSTGDDDGAYVQCWVWVADPEEVKP